MEGTWYVLRATKDGEDNTGGCPVDTYILRNNSTVTYLNGFNIGG